MDECLSDEYVSFDPDSAFVRIRAGPGRLEVKMKIEREIEKFPEYDNNCFSVRMQSKSGNMFTPTHYHDCVEIIYCTEGSFVVNVQDEKYGLYAGDMVVILIDEVHSLYPTGGKDNKYLVIKFNLPMLYSLSQSETETAFLNSFSTAAMLSRRLFEEDTLRRTPVPEMMQSMILESRNKNFGYEIAIRADIIKLFLWILRSWKTDGGTQEILGTRIDVIPALKKVFVFVEYHYMEPITMETVADSLHMNYYAFSKFFSHHTGKKFPDYLNSVRMKKAKMLLASTAKNIAEVGEEVGYTTPSYFIKRFKDENGMTPQQYRALIFDSRL